MSKVDRYRVELRTLADWKPFLLAESGLPGPRGNLELADAVAEEGNEALFRAYSAIGADQAPANTPGEFLAVCGMVGLGRLLAEGQRELLPLLRAGASDRRWRIREAVAIALQRLGKQDMAALLDVAEAWSGGNLLERRAAAAAVCEPVLLSQAAQVRRVLAILDTITASLAAVSDRRSDDFKTLRKGLAYCWSVAVAALPAEGKPAMEKWLQNSDRDVAWLMKENLKKNRLQRIDPTWVERWQAQLALPARGATT